MARQWYIYIVIFVEKIYISYYWSELHELCRQRSLGEILTTLIKKINIRISEGKNEAE